MQISSINSVNTNSFGAKLFGDCDEILMSAVKNGFQAKRGRKILKELGRILPDNFTITMRKPQAGSVTGRVIVENEKGNGVDMVVSPVIMDARNVLVKYSEAARLLSRADMSKNRGLYTIS